MKEAQQCKRSVVAERVCWRILATTTQLLGLLQARRAAPIHVLRESGVAVHARKQHVFMQADAHMMMHAFYS
eukprot:5590546-Pleurochrysis_carterae.AAC.1